jgi:hypothetical protein
MVDSYHNTTHTHAVILHYANSNKKPKLTFELMARTKLLSIGHVGSIVVTKLAIKITKLSTGERVSMSPEQMQFSQSNAALPAKEPQEKLLDMHALHLHCCPLLVLIYSIGFSLLCLLSAAAK